MADCGHFEDAVRLSKAWIAEDERVSFLAGYCCILNYACTVMNELSEHQSYQYDSVRILSSVCNWGSLRPLFDSVRVTCAQLAARLWAYLPTAPPKPLVMPSGKHSDCRELPLSVVGNRHTSSYLGELSKEPPRWIKQPKKSERWILNRSCCKEGEHSGTPMDYTRTTM
jgi:hypothetical protein